MRIDTLLIGKDFIPNQGLMQNDAGQTVYYITDSDSLFIDNKRYFDRRTGYLNTEFTPAAQDKVLSDLTWYVNYMRLNYMLLAAFMSNNPGKQLSSLNLLNIGYIPIGYSPSFLDDLNPFIVRLLELRKVPYVLYRATVMGNNYYKTDTKDVWVSKLDAAKYLGCGISDVTFSTLLGGLLHGK